MTSHFHRASTSGCTTPGKGMSKIASLAYYAAPFAVELPRNAIVLLYEEFSDRLAPTGFGCASAYSLSLRSGLKQVFLEDRAGIEVFPTISSPYMVCRVMGVCSFCDILYRVQRVTKVPFRYICSFFNVNGAHQLVNQGLTPYSGLPLIDFEPSRALVITR